ncbi:ABC transporter permease [Hoeflea sp. BAL378]|uniref:ABC transporter permease n=1 Tax=Hoeflea sp. BAL378 TaxID=1547437 RepID=UPI0005147CCA|nr:ABC transporter permease [Hoeflea sp. BAL378]KGF70461.1 ABC transporter permease [Hoeflea sp. BAL378]
MTFYAFMGAVEAGLIFGLVAIGVYLSFRVLDFPDLTVDGSFPLGAAVAAVLITSGVNPFLATAIAVAAGFVAGYITATLHIRLNILNLLASILVMLALFSINLRIMGRPNLPLLSSETVFSPLKALSAPSYMTIPVALAVVVAAGKLVLDWFLATEIGLALRAAGANARMASAQGIDRNRMLPLGLGISNSYTALAGALFAQSQGFADVGMGIGIIIVGLAAVIVGETIISPRTVLLATLSAIVGSLIYRIVLAFALNLDQIGLRAQDLNLVTALLIVLALSLARARGSSFPKLRAARAASKKEQQGNA